MKKYIFGLLALGLVFTYISCEEKLVIFDNVNGQEALQFTQSSLDVTVPPAGISVTLPVSVTTVSTTSRTFNASVDDSSTAISGTYTIGSITIPAGSYDGTLDISFSNATALTDGIAYDLVLKLTAPQGGATFNDIATIKYFKKVVCNDLLLVVITDAYPEETSWEIKNASGTVVASGPSIPYGPASSASSRGKRYEHNINLPDGCYTLIMKDAYSDGQYDGAYSGSYSLTCSILTHATGAGAWTPAQGITDFCINP